MKPEPAELLSKPLHSGTNKKRGTEERDHTDDGHEEEIEKIGNIALARLFLSFGHRVAKCHASINLKGRVETPHGC